MVRDESPTGETGLAGDDDIANLIHLPDGISQKETMDSMVQSDKGKVDHRGRACKAQAADETTLGWE